jgi:hypothetical protein
VGDEAGRERLSNVVAQQPGTPAQSGILLSGNVPPLADTYYTRTETGPDLADSQHPGETVVLLHGDEADPVLAAQGGTGKTQLAVEFAHAMWNGRVVEILVWVTATNAESIITGFAQAANTVDGSNPGEGAEAAARFVSWLAHTARPWALIIDDLCALADLEDLWPGGESGRILITTKLPAASFESKDVRIVPVPRLSRRETLFYLSSRLTDHPGQRIEALDLGEDLDGLPLGLAQATAVMNARKQGCREYRAQFAERRKHMSAMDGVSAAVLATWSLAAECAHELLPAGCPMRSRSMSGRWPTATLVSRSRQLLPITTTAGKAAAWSRAAAQPPEPVTFFPAARKRPGQVKPMSVRKIR